MKKILIVVVLTCIILINNGCPKSCIEANYTFSVNSQISPDRDSIKVGDTIYITSSFPVKLTDQNSGAEINYAEAKKIGSTLGVGRLVTGNAVPIDAVFDFNYIAIKGNVYNERSIPSPDGVQQLTYQESNSSYELKVGLIAKAKGVYVLGIGNGLSVGRKNSKNCEKAAFNISISNTSQHVYYYQIWRPGYTLTSSDLKRLYCFKVK